MDELEVISLVVVCVVVFFYALAFFMSFRKTHKYEAASIAGITMDEDIAESLVREDYGYFRNEMEIPKREGHPVTFGEYREMKMKRQSLSNTLSNVFVGIFYVVILLILGMGIYFKAVGEQIFVGNYSYMVIETGSMSKKLASNTYLTDDMTNQIQTFDFIQLEKISSDDDIKLYDVVAYKNTETDMIIVHRVIDKTEHDGVWYYKFRGDANQYSSDFETYGPTGGTGYGLTLNNFVGEYTGFHSLPLGLAIDYFRSDIGIICAASGIVALVFFYFYDDRTNKAIDERERYVVERIDESSDRRYKWYLCYYRSSKSYKQLTEAIYID